jgi:type III pantothenate kinase
MLLVVDVGNTNVVFALFAQGADGGREIRARWRIATDPRRTGDEYAVWLLQLIAVEGLTREAVTRMIVSTVVGRARHKHHGLGRKT